MRLMLPFVVLCLCLFGMLISSGCTDKEKCVNAGGTWHSFWITGDNCNFLTKDNGTQCRDGSECEGECIRDETVQWNESTNITGRCSAWRVVYGCHRLVENGTASHYFCYE
jgi:hypothetical protein